LKWYSSIPEHIRPAVKLFPSRQFHLLLFAWQCGQAALYLEIDNPALSYMLASNWLFHQPKARNPLRSARLLLELYKKQKDILEWLMFPATNKVRNIIRRIDNGAININSLVHLRQSSLDRPDTLKVLSHLDSINADILRIVTDQNLHKSVTETFIEDISIGAALLQQIASHI